MSNIASVLGREILDSRGNPTVEVEVTLESGIVARAAVPSGASTGSREALEMRDGDAKRYGGKGVLQAVENVNGEIADALTGMDVLNQVAIDNTLVDLDDTDNKSRLGAILKKDGHAASVGDEGGYAPNLKSHDEAFAYIIRAIEDAGYNPGSEVMIAIDAASTAVYPDGKYVLAGEGKEFNSVEMVQWLSDFKKKYPLISIEDGCAESDWEGWSMLTSTLGDNLQLVGDDLFVTNASILAEGIDKGIANSILVKLNQIGTVTETMDAIELAHNSGYSTVISHRSGETDDNFIADLSVGVNAGQIKTGSLCRSERMSKYNQLLRIEEELGDNAEYYGPLLADYYFPAKD